MIDPSGCAYIGYGWWLYNAFQSTYAQMNAWHGGINVDVYDRYYGRGKWGLVGVDPGFSALELLPGYSMPGGGGGTGIVAFKGFDGWTITDAGKKMGINFLAWKGENGYWLDFKGTYGTMTGKYADGNSFTAGSGVEIGSKWIGLSYSDPSGQGDMMLQNEIDGFKRIWNNSFAESTEYVALVTSKGLITFNVGKNGGDLFGGLPSTWKGNKCFVDFNGKSYQMLGSVHVHWDKSMDATPSYWNPQTGGGDQSAAYYTLRGQIPVFVLGWDENIYSISYRTNFSDFLRNYYVNSLLNGNLSLIRLLQQNP